MDSREVAEWQAYEQHSGPLGTVWLHETLANIHEQLQSLNHLTGQAHFTDKQHRTGPIPKPEHYPRPHEVITKATRDED